MRETHVLERRQFKNSKIEAIYKKQTVLLELVLNKPKTPGIMQISIRKYNERQYKLTMMLNLVHVTHITAYEQPCQTVELSYNTINRFAGNHID